MLKRLLVDLGVLPTRYMWPNPLKIIEYEELLDGVELRSSDVIMDLGCGSGPQDLLLARKVARVVGIDISSAQIERAERLAADYARGRQLEFRCTPLERAGFAPREFDKIVSFCVFEHIVNRDEVLGVMAHILKPGGQLLLSVDSLAGVTNQRLLAKHRAEHAVQTYFTPADLRETLEAHGFRDVAIRPIFRSPYTRRIFEAAIDRSFHFHRYRKFWTLARMKLEEYRYRDRDSGLFLCASCLKPA